MYKLEASHLFKEDSLDSYSADSVDLFALSDSSLTLMTSTMPPPSAANRGRIGIGLPRHMVVG
jgi:hypothetical protein